LQGKKKYLEERAGSSLRIVPGKEDVSQKSWLKSAGDESVGAIEKLYFSRKNKGKMTTGPPRCRALVM